MNTYLLKKSLLSFLVLGLVGCGAEGPTPTQTPGPIPEKAPVTTPNPATADMEPQWLPCGDLAIDPADGSDLALVVDRNDNPRGDTIEKGRIFERFPLSNRSLVKREGLYEISCKDNAECFVRARDITDSCPMNDEVDVISGVLVLQETTLYTTSPSAPCQLEAGTLLPLAGYRQDSRNDFIEVTLKESLDRCPITKGNIKQQHAVITPMYFGVPTEAQVRLAEIRQDNKIKEEARVKKEAAEKRQREAEQQIAKPVIDEANEKLALAEQKVAEANRIAQQTVSQAKATAQSLVSAAAEEARRVGEAQEKAILSQVDKALEVERRIEQERLTTKRAQEREEAEKREAQAQAQKIAAQEAAQRKLQELIAGFGNDRCAIEGRAVTLDGDVVGEFFTSQARTDLLKKMRDAGLCDSAMSARLSYRDFFFRIDGKRALLAYRLDPALDGLTDSIRAKHFEPNKNLGCGLQDKSITFNGEPAFFQQFETDRLKDFTALVGSGVCERPEEKAPRCTFKNGQLFIGGAASGTATVGEFLKLVESGQCR